jgi:hypothetical protein
MWMSVDNAPLLLRTRGLVNESLRVRLMWIYADGGFFQGAVSLQA